MWDEWGKAITAASGADSGNIYQNYANAGVIDASPAQFAGRKAAIQADIEERRRKEEAAIAAKKKEMDDEYEASKKDPSKAYMEMDENGRYRYFNGAGEMLNINQFSLLTGKRPDEILADSENPYDQKFVSDYKTMRDFASAWVNGDNATLQKFREADPEKYNELISTYKSPAEMVNAFREYYSDYYGDTAGKNEQTPRFSISSMYGVGDDEAGKQMASQLAGSSLEQTLSPINMNAPQQPNFLDRIADTAGTYGPLALLGGGSLWGKSDRQSAWERYEEDRKNNPWMAYQSYLQGPR